MAAVPRDGVIKDRTCLMGDSELGLGGISANDSPAPIFALPNSLPVKMQFWGTVLRVFSMLVQYGWSFFYSFINGLEDFMVRHIDEWPRNLVSRPSVGPRVTQYLLHAVDWFTAPLLLGHEPANIRLDPSGVVLARGKVRVIHQE